MSSIYNSLLQLLASTFNVGGTILAILSILRLTPEDIHKAITIKGIDERDSELIIQRKQARLGIMFVIYGWVLQGIGLFLNISSKRTFFCVLASELFVAIILILLMMRSNNRFEKKCLEYKSEVGETDPPHGDLHGWTYLEESNIGDCDVPSRD